MVIKRSNEYIKSLFRELCNLPAETEWVEFKHNNAKPDTIGEYISALANSAKLFGKTNAYIIWGVDDQSHSIIGTTFNPRQAKIGNEELENWLLLRLSPKIDFQFYEQSINDKRIVLLEIGAAFKHPVQFQHNEYIRVGSYKKKLKDFPEKERELWRIFDKIPFEQEIASEGICNEEVLRFLDYPVYFDLLSLPLPETQEGILRSFEIEELIVKSQTGKWDITNLGAILFAKNLGDFSKLKRKALRIVQYDGVGRFSTIREREEVRGYACIFKSVIEYIMTLLPSNEIINKAIRSVSTMIPELSIRELVANAIIHQDFYSTGVSPMVEIFSNRIEITNPGSSLVESDRFLDSPPKSRNEALASFMRRIGICEERGSGIDKVVFETELYQLPAPIFETEQDYTRITLFSHRELNDMDRQDKVRACYLHACLKYVQRDFMTNATLRNRFTIESKNSAIVSRIIRDTIDSNLICKDNELVGTKSMKYVPFWAKK